MKNGNRFPFKLAKFFELFVDELDQPDATKVSLSTIKMVINTKLDASCVE